MSFRKRKCTTVVIKLSMEVTKRPNNRQGNNNGNMVCKHFLGVFPITFEVCFRQYYLFGNLKEVIIILLFASGLGNLGIVFFVFVSFFNYYFPQQINYFIGC